MYVRIYIKNTVIVVIVMLGITHNALPAAVPVRGHRSYPPPPPWTAIPPCAWLRIMFPAAAAGPGEFMSGFCEKNQELVNRQLNSRKTWEKRDAMGG